MTVTGTNTGTGFKQSVKTGETGVYRLTLLPLGTYEVEAQAAGFATSRHTGVELNAGAVRTVDIALSLAGTATTVEVVAGAALTDPSRSDIGSTLDTNMVRNLPLVSRNPYNFILFQPNVSGRGNTEFGVPRKINANGFNGRINYQIDGSNNTESDRAGIRLIPISNTYVEEIQQVSNGFAPEFGNTVGTVFNTITRSGTNEFHGEGSYIFRRTDFSARPKLLAPTAATPASERRFLRGRCGRAAHSRQALLLRRVRTRETRSAGAGDGSAPRPSRSSACPPIMSTRFHSAKAFTSTWRRPTG